MLGLCIGIDGHIGWYIGQSTHRHSPLAQRGFFAGTGELAVFTKQGDQLPVNLWVSSEAFLLIQEIGLSREVADQTTRFGDEKRTRRHVPR